jgi:hypothetical protein
MGMPETRGSAQAAPVRFGSGGGTRFGGRPILPGNRPAWAIMASPEDLRCQFGLVVPSLAKAWFVPGRNGNGRQQDFGAGARKTLENVGYREVPNTIECVVWGQRRDAQTEGVESNYLARWEGQTALGAAVVYYTDAWQRPVMVGRRVAWRTDWPGYLDFLLRVRRLVWPGDLVPEQLQQAMAGQIQIARDLLRRETRAAGEQLQRVLMHLPAEHAPLDLQPRVREAQHNAQQRGDWHWAFGREPGPDDTDDG